MYNHVTIVTNVYPFHVCVCLFRIIFIMRFISYVAINFAGSFFQNCHQKRINNHIRGVYFIEMHNLQA